MSRAESPLTGALQTISEFDKAESYTYKITEKAYGAIIVLATQGLKSPDQSLFLMSAQWLTSYVENADYKEPFIRFGEKKGEEFKFAAEVCKQNIGILAETVDKGRTDEKSRQRSEASIRLMNELYKHGNGEAKKAVLEQYTKLQVKIVRQMLTGGLWFDDAVVNYLNEFPFNNSYVLKMAENTVKFIGRKDFRPMIKALFMNEKTRDMGELLGKICLKKIGYTEDEIATQAEDNESEWEFVADNLDNIFNLEHRVKGVTKWLMHGQGITHFGRYPVELLMDQLTYIDDRKNPWGIIINPDYDHNGAFQEGFMVLQRFKNQIDNAFGKEKQKHRIRIIEGASLFSLAKTLIRLHRQYGPMSFVILGGHGSKKDVTFGFDEPTKLLTQKDVEKGLGIRRFFVKYCSPDAVFILQSCLTGKEKGIAQALSGLGLRVLAPTESTSLDALNVSVQGKEVQVDPHFGKGTKNEYRGGKLVKKEKNK